MAACHSLQGGGNAFEYVQLLYKMSWCCTARHGLGVCFNSDVLCLLQKVAFVVIQISETGLSFTVWLVMAAVSIMC